MISGDLKNQLIDKLNKAGIEDARFICMEIINKFDGDETAIISAIDKVSQGYPYEYIVGHKAFYRSEFLVSEGVLIPRSDTEVLVEAALRFLGVPELYMGDVLKIPMGKLNHDICFCDVCTGTGCIGISVSNEIYKQGYKSKGTLVDISPMAIEIACKNINKCSPVSDSLKIIKSDILNEIPDLLNQDVILSNPPYVTDEEMKELPENVKYEPELALRADNDGLAFYEPLCKFSMKALKSGGALLVEHGFLQGEKVREIFETNGFSQVVTIKDYGGNDRVTFGRKP